MRSRSLRRSTSDGRIASVRRPGRRADGGAGLERGDVRYWDESASVTTSPLGQKRTREQVVFNPTSTIARVLKQTASLKQIKALVRCRALLHLRRATGQKHNQAPRQVLGSDTLHAICEARQVVVPEPSSHFRLTGPLPSRPCP